MRAIALLQRNAERGRVLGLDLTRHLVLAVLQRGRVQDLDHLAASTRHLEPLAGILGRRVDDEVIDRLDHGLERGDAGVLVGALQAELGLELLVALVITRVVGDRQLRALNAQLLGVVVDVNLRGTIVEFLDVAGSQKGSIELGGSDGRHCGLGWLSDTEKGGNNYRTQTRREASILVRGAVIPGAAD